MIITHSQNCDDGNIISLDGCDSTCLEEPGWSCATTGTPGSHSTTCGAICGDLFQVSGELCDDGNNTDTMGCKSNCSGELNGWHCSGGSPTSPATCVEQCGDGYITTNEHCEDGGTANLDGCDSNCLLENGLMVTNAVENVTGFLYDVSTLVPICGDAY